MSHSQRRGRESLPHPEAGLPAPSQDSLIFTFSSQAELTRKLIDHLSALGYTVAKGQWFRWKALGEAYDLETDTARARVNKYMEMHPGTIEIKRDGGNKVTSIFMTPDLDRELRRPLVKGGRKYES